LRVHCIQVLLDMVFDRNHEQGFAKPRRLIQRFESSGASDAAALGHHAQKFRPIQFMEEKRGVVAPDRLDLRLFAKAV
jgi:hypothetical protein